MTTREARLNETFVALADTLVTGFDLTDLMYTLTTACVDVLEVDAAGIMLASPGAPLRVIGSSDEHAGLLELFELQNHEGPCIDCHRSGEVIAEEDLTTTTRWPDFTPRAREAGFGSVAAIPLRLRADVIGALNLFRYQKGGVSPADLRAARALADVATIGLLQSRMLEESQLMAEQLQAALRSRVIIEQAKGVLSEQGNTSVELAFEVMRRHARRNQVAVDQVARQVIDGTRTLGQLL